MKRTVLWPLLWLPGWLGAVEFSAGLKGGGNFEQLWGVNPHLCVKEESVECWGVDPGFSSPKLGFAGGAYATIGFLEMFAVQPEILYVRKGGKRSQSSSGQAMGPNGLQDTTTTLIWTYQFDFVQFPLLFKVYAPGTEVAHPHFLLGPYYAVLARHRFIPGGSIKRGATIESLKETSGLPTEPGRATDREYGLVAGLGVDWGLGTFDLRYTLGLAPLYPDTEDDSKTGTITMQVGFLFVY